MRSIGLKTLKNKLSEYVRLAASGETVLVTDRDRVVAEIGPPNPTRSSMLSDALLLDAIRQGWIKPPISVGKGPPARKPAMKTSAKRWGGSMIYLDSTVSFAHLLAEDRFPPDQLWDEQLVSSRLLNASFESYQRVPAPKFARRRGTEL
jgi:antitoxin (DNA-binding transcriptional repressor) of toxin-antitoxin stability system